ncbi:MAG: DUF3786 domain-containing protein [Desulfobacterales bacterium]|nr:DUF3786 domain-containing protein [Desulfobacterales bacterium]
MPTEQDYKTARALALDRLEKLDIDACCANAGLSIETISTAKRVTIPYLGNTYHLTLSDGRISFDEDDNELKIPDQVVMLHYLITATGAPVEGKWITFREAPSGSFYYPAFVKRAIVPLVKCFGHAPEMLEKVAGAVGQIVELAGDKSLKVLALPRVPVVLSVWKGDEEFPAEGSIYLDASVGSYLSTAEDVAYLASAVVYKAIGTARGMR